MKRYEYNYGKNPEGTLSTISGYATETTNFGETAFGILNKSTRDEENFTTPEVVSSSTATLFSVGNGTDHDSRKNIIELKADGTVYINGVGQYDGTNPGEATDIADEFQGIHDDITGLNEDVDRIDNTIESIHISEDDENLIYTLLVDGQERGTINIPRDQFLKNVSYNEETNNLEFTFIVRGENNEEVEKQINVNMTDLEDIYSAGDGLNLENKQFSVKVDADTQPYIEVTANGVKVIGIDEALDKKVSWDETKTVITIPANGSISALRNNGLEGGVLVCQRTYDEGATYTTEIGTTKNSLTLNSTQRPKIDFADGTSENVAYQSEITDISSSLNNYLPLSGGEMTGDITHNATTIGSNRVEVLARGGGVTSGSRLNLLGISGYGIDDEDNQTGVFLANNFTDNWNNWGSALLGLNIHTVDGNTRYTANGVTLPNKTASDILTAAASTVRVSTINGTPIMTSEDQAFNLAPLENGLVPAAYLPSYVDDVLEYSSVDAFPETGESGKIYVDTTTNLTYRWSGSQYIEVSKSIGLGTSSTDAYPGNLGQQNANNIAALQGDITDINQVIEDLGNTYVTINTLPEKVGSTYIGSRAIDCNRMYIPLDDDRKEMNFTMCISTDYRYAFLSVEGELNKTQLYGTPGNYSTIHFTNSYLKVTSNCDSLQTRIVFNTIDGNTYLEVNLEEGSRTGYFIELYENFNKYFPLLENISDGSDMEVSSRVTNLNFSSILGGHIGILGKSNQDLLNAAGGTTSISDILAEVPSPDLSSYATKVDLSGYLPLSGGSMLGNILFAPNPSTGGIGAIRVRGTTNPDDNGEFYYMMGTSGFSITATQMLGTRIIDMGRRSKEMGGLGYLDFYDNYGVISLSVNSEGVVISNKSENDLLNAAGSTTSVSSIATQVQASIIDSAPETLDTLNELAAALGDDPNFATTVTNLIGTKVDNSKWETIANTNIVTSIDDFSYAEDSIQLNHKFILKNDNGSFNAESQTGKTINAATSTTAGAMSAADKAKLDSLSTVATSGSYNDLTDTPTIPTVQSGQTGTNTNYVYSSAADEGYRVLSDISCTRTGDVVKLQGRSWGMPSNSSLDLVTLPLASSSMAGLMSTTDKSKLDQITITEGDIVANGFRVTDGTANEVLTADGDSNTLKTINGQTLLGSGDVDMSEFALKTDLDDYLSVGGGTVAGDISVESIEDTNTLIITNTGINISGKTNDDLLNAAGSTTSIDDIADDIEKLDRFLRTPSGLPDDNNYRGGSYLTVNAIADYIDGSTRYTTNIPVEYYYSYDEKYVKIGSLGSVEVHLSGIVTVNDKPVVSSSKGSNTIWTGTQSEYEAVAAKNANILYFITED